MFPVARYNPGAPAPKKDEQRSSKGRKKRKLVTKAKPSLTVIAPDEDEGRARAQTASRATQNEAADDLDLLWDDPVHEEEEAAGALPSDGPAQEEDDPTKGSDRHQPPHKRGGAKVVHSPEVAAALHAASLPLDQVADVWQLAPFLRDNLRRDGFAHFFPIQALVIPNVLSSERHPYLRAPDVCLTAPTGSGKTLGYVLPVLQALAGRRVGRLRALVVLPSRDLATQVHSVFLDYIQGSQLKAGLAIGQSDWKAEQMALTVDPSAADSAAVAQRKLAFEPGNLDWVLHAGRSGLSKEYVSWSAIDILVCTPGRLVDHLDHTPGFTLEHLKFLVVDEADRLLSQSYQNWIDRVIDSANAASQQAWREMEANDNQLAPLQLSEDGTAYEIRPRTWRRGGAAGDTSAFHTNTSHLGAVATVCRPVQLRKFLVSATLTKDPQKLATLRLVNPQHFDVHQLSAGSGGGNKFAMPAALSEYTIECKAEQKPLVLLALLLELRQEETAEKRTVVVFTASVDSTHRLARLLQLLWIRGTYGAADAVAEFSSALNQAERTALLTRCRDPQDALSVLVCSDGMSRGMDLESVHAVLNYDVPSLARTYVHRCGRTARAGKEGRSISILKGGQVPQFRRMRALVQNPQAVASWSVKESLVRNVASDYRACLQVLRQLLKEEGNGERSPTATLDANVFQPASKEEEHDESDEDGEDSHPSS
jgi:ATP-dependent RNA helicase DDX51/DBP6